MGIFEYNDYKLFVRNRIREMARAGRGQYQKMALHLRVHPTLVSQIFRGVRDLTPEQASEVAVFLELSEPESQYFLTLVQISRAGNQRLRELLERRRQWQALSPMASTAG